MCLSYCSVAVERHCDQGTYEREHLIGRLLTVLEGKSIIVMEGSVAAGRHGTGAITKSSHLICML